MLLREQEGTWAKVGLLRRLLEEVPPERAQWVLFAQPDALIDDIAFTFPFDNYQDKDLVVLGNATRLAAGDPGGDMIFEIPTTSSIGPHNVVQFRQQWSCYSL